MIGATSFAGNVVGQGISKGFNKINYGEALTSAGTDLLSFGMARKFGPAVKAFGNKVVSKVTNTSSKTFNSIATKVTKSFGLMDDVADGVCFVAGTLINTGDGFKRIEEIKAGDYVWSEDPVTKEKGLKKVVQTFINEKDVLIKLFIDGTTIETTETHPFWVPGKGWIAAKDLNAGDILQQSSGERLSIDDIQKVYLDKSIKVYNFEVEGWHTYFVSGKSFLVHNSCSGPRGRSTPNEAYNRQKHYGSTPTKADRKAIGGQSVDHDPPLVKRYYEGDPKIGEKPGYLQTPAQRRASASDRSRMKPATRAEQNRQGGQMSQYSRVMKNKYGF